MTGNRAFQMASSLLAVFKEDRERISQIGRAAPFALEVLRFFRSIHPRSTQDFAYLDSDIECLGKTACSTWNFSGTAESRKGSCLLIRAIHRDSECGGDRLTILQRNFLVQRNLPSGQYPAQGFVMMCLELPSPMSGSLGAGSSGHHRHFVETPSESRLAKMEAGNPSVSLDLIFKSLFHLGISRKELVQILC